jgi:hypothetical protein
MRTLNTATTAVNSSMSLCCAMVLSLQHTLSLQHMCRSLVLVVITEHYHLYLCLSGLAVQAVPTLAAGVLPTEAGAAYGAAHT